jgi:hypothetical protein
MTAWAALSLAIFAAVMQTILSQSGERPERSGEIIRIGPLAKVWIRTQH